MSGVSSSIDCRTVSQAQTALDWIPKEFRMLDQQDLIRERHRSIPLPDGWCELDGKRLRNFASNDYLDLAHHPQVIAAACEATRQGGAGASASALVTGRTVWHEALETKLAEFTRQPAVLLFPTGFAANTGTIPALVGSGDVIFSDRLNHRSLIDGCRLSGASIQVYEHADVDELETALSRASGVRRKLIVTDTLFSMDGDCAPLSELCELAERSGAMLMIDEAHAIGVLGSHGGGVAESMQVESRIPIRVGTLSKGLGSHGGFVAGSHELIDWLWNQARTHMFSTALPPSACAAASAALDVLAEEPWRREHVLARAAELRAGLGELSRGGENENLWITPHETTQLGQIVVIIVHSAQGAVDAAAKLADRGYLVAAIRPPTVAPGTSRLRISLSAAHTSDDIAGLIAALGDALGTK